MSEKKLPTRRDYNEARGYLVDMFGDGAEGESLAWAADFLISHAQEIKVQRHNDLLVLKFDLNDDQGKLPEATDDEEREFVPALVADQHRPVRDEPQA